MHPSRPYLERALQETYEQLFLAFSHLKVLREYFRFDEKANGLLFVVFFRLFSFHFISFYFSFINVYCSKTTVLKRLRRHRWCSNDVTNKMIQKNWTDFIFAQHLFVHQSFVFNLVPMLKQSHFNANDHNCIYTMQFPNWQCMHLLAVSIVDEYIFALFVLFATSRVQFQFTYELKYVRVCLIAFKSTS